MEIIVFPFPEPIIPGEILTLRSPSQVFLRKYLFFAIRTDYSSVNINFSLPERIIPKEIFVFSLPEPVFRKEILVFPCLKQIIP